MIAGPDWEKLVHQVEAVAHSSNITVGAKIARPIFYDIAGDEYARIGLARDADEGVLLVVLKPDVETWGVRLDMRRLEDEGLLLGVCDEIVDVNGVADYRCK